MSRSFKKTPIGSNAGGSDKKDKQRANRRHRRLVRMAMLNGEHDVLPKLREVSNPWSFSKDGKQYFGNSTRFDPKWMRK